MQTFPILLKKTERAKKGGPGTVFCLERSTSSSDAASDRLDETAAHPHYLQLMGQSIKRQRERRDKGRGLLNLSV